MRFHFMFSGIQQSSDIRINRIFLKCITFHFHTILIHIKIKTGKVHRVAEQIDIFVSGSQINRHKLRNTGIVDKNPDKSFAGNLLLGLNKRMIQANFRFVARIDSRFHQSGSIRTHQMIIYKSRIKDIARIRITHFENVNSIMHPVSYRKATHYQDCFHLILQ